MRFHRVIGVGEFRVDFKDEPVPIAERVNDFETPGLKSLVSKRV